MIKSSYCCASLEHSQMADIPPIVIDGDELVWILYPSFDKISYCPFCGKEMRRISKDELKDFGKEDRNATTSL